MNRHFNCRTAAAAMMTMTARTRRRRASALALTIPFAALIALAALLAPLQCSPFFFVVAQNTEGLAFASDEEIAQQTTAAAGGGGKDDAGAGGGGDGSSDDSDAGDPPPSSPSSSSSGEIATTPGGETAVAEDGGPSDGMHAIRSYDCIDPDNRGLTHVVRRGELTTVCVYVGPGGDWNAGIDYKRFSVNLVADEFSSYELPDSYAAIVNRNTFKNNATHVFAASQASLSFMRRYYDKTNGRIYPYLTAIIDVEDGVVRGITWDDACVFCEKKKCLANTYNFDGTAATFDAVRQPVDGCYFTEAECNGFVLDKSNTCNLKLHAVWTGTDVNGKVLLSSDSRFSMFPPNRVQENVKGRYDSMVESITNLKNKIPLVGDKDKEDPAR